jgi:predicted adenylyl cyclase CyaB
VEVNNVKGLGWFLEIEYLCDEKEMKMAREEVVEAMRYFGIDEKKCIRSGYTKMLWDKK